MHATAIELELERLISKLRYAETAQRGYLLTHDSAFLKPFDNNIIRIKASVAEVKEMLADDPIQLKKLAELEELINLRYTLLIQNIIDPSKFIGLPDSVRRKIEYGNQLTEKARVTMREMLDYQNKQIDALRYEHNKYVIQTPILFGSIVFFTIVIFTYLFVRQFINGKRLKRANSELLVINESFVKGENLAKMGNWRYTFSTGKTNYSANFHALIGLKSEDKINDFKYYLSFVSKEDKALVINAFRDAYKNYKPFTISYKVILKDSKVKYIKSTGEIITDNNNEKHLIGISLDITDLVYYNKQLELKNRKLEVYNADLASFNYVASHDLQAPLRKIQMFISRLYDIEAQNLTATGREFLDRIHASASQMQRLINDLLMFSRTNAGNKRFEKTDLNVILKNVKDELSEIIAEKGAVVSNDLLPVINVIEYQIQQLFINLLSNSLKFVKNDTLPQISITCTTISHKKLSKFITLDEDFHFDKYFVLTFKDNGIGFEKTYATKVFQLLFRLHEKSVYPGTGIGLAICKKIVENHHGYITAESNPGEGAWFTIYLPQNLK